MAQHIIKKATNISEMPNAFSSRPLEGDNLQEFYVDTIEVRTADPYKSPIEDIYDACTNPSENHIFLLMGHIGCGKSTELNKLALRLRRCGYKVRIVNCLDDLGASPQYTDLLILIGEALFKIANEIGCTFDSELGKTILEFWNTEITQITTDKAKYTIKMEAGASVESPSIFASIFKTFASIKTGIKLQQTDSKEYKQKIEKRSEQWYYSIATISDLITKQLEGKQPIIIFEDIDKLDRVNPNAVWDMFSVHVDNLSCFSFPIVYTFPISMSYDPKYGTLMGYFDEKILPMIELQFVDGQYCQKGYDAIERIVKDRANMELIENSTLRLMIIKTGGSLRDLFFVIRDASNRARRRGANRIEMEDAIAALNTLKTSLTRRIETKDYKFLNNILNGYKRNIEDRKKLLEMLTANVVLEYNSERWQSVHPLVADFLVENAI